MRNTPPSCVTSATDPFGQSVERSGQGLVRPLLQLLVKVALL